MNALDPVRVGNVLLVLSALPATLAFLVYGLGVTWWRSRWGKHLVGYMFAVALTLDLGVIRLFYLETPWFDWARVAAYVLVVVALWWRLLFVIQAWREGSPDESPRQVTTNRKENRR